MKGCDSMFYNSLTESTAVDSVYPELDMEAALIESCSNDELLELLEEGTVLNTMVAEGVLTEASIVRLDKHAKRNRMFMQSVFVLAREANDKDYKKLLTVLKMRNVLEKKLVKKFGPKAERRVKELIKEKRKVQSMTGKK